ncbi:universal stress protein [Desulfohalovibrio reitneri]|uniref:universal stress protein n=1 Tax=Desulfohalovibrio reitneri TaxID=1307759 RepID=UPI0004A77DB2|nr:universal stress protein [Desulfohalovibrio reitneri]
MRVNKILLPVDGSTHSRKACEMAIEQARANKASIILLHCHKPVPLALGQPNFQEMTEYYSREANDLLAPFREMLEDSGIEYQDKVIGGPTASVIVEVAEAEECDLVIMGTRGKSNLEGLVLGSVTHRVLQTSPCPVLVVR